MVLSGDGIYYIHVPDLIIAVLIRSLTKVKRNGWEILFQVADYTSYTGNQLLATKMYNLGLNFHSYRAWPYEARARGVLSCR